MILMEKQDYQEGMSHFSYATLVKEEFRCSVSLLGTRVVVEKRRHCYDEVRNEVNTLTRCFMFSQPAYDMMGSPNDMVRALCIYL